MPVDAHTLDIAFGTLESFGPDLRLPQAERLKKEFPQLAGPDAEEVLKHIDAVPKSVWSLAERGGEAKMKKSDIVAELQVAHPFLREKGLKQAVFLVNYCAWHEGYDK
jgi:hypothetical protein